jgi:5'-nucleotidase
MKRLIAVLAAVIGLVTIAASLGATASAYPPGQAPQISLDKSTVPAGSPVTVFGQKFTPNQQADLSLHSTPVALGVVSVDANGNFTAQVTIPAGTTNGAHTVEALDVASGDVATAPLTVTGSTTGGGGPPGGTLGGTGVAVIGIGALGAVLLVGGLLMLMAGRRRKVTV